MFRSCQQARRLGFQAAAGGARGARRSIVQIGGRGRDDQCRQGAARGRGTGCTSIPSNAIVAAGVILLADSRELSKGNVTHDVQNNRRPSLTSGPVPPRRRAYRSASASQRQNDACYVRFGRSGESFHHPPSYLKSNATVARQTVPHQEFFQCYVSRSAKCARAVPILRGGPPHCEVVLSRLHSSPPSREPASGPCRLPMPFIVLSLCTGKFQGVFGQLGELPVCTTVDRQNGASGA